MKPAFLVAALILAAAPAVAQPVPDWKTATQIEVVFAKDGFHPGRIAMAPGAPYIVRFVNRADRTHNFSAHAFFGRARVDPRDQGLNKNNDVVLEPGQSTILHLITPRTPGRTYEFTSNRVADAVSGFKGVIVMR